MNNDDEFLKKAFASVGVCKNCPLWCMCRTQGNEERRSANVDCKMQTDFTTLMASRELQDMASEGRVLDSKIRSKFDSMKREVPSAKVVLIDTECRKKSVLEQSEAAHRISAIDEFKTQGRRITRPVAMKTHDPEKFKHVRLVRPRNPRIHK